MPLIQATIVEGRSLELKERLIRNLTEAVVQTLRVKPESVRIVLQEVPKAHWGAGGISMLRREGGA